jgi:hypothetical protein
MDRTAATQNQLSMREPFYPVMGKKRRTPFLAFYAFVA